MHVQNITGATNRRLLIKVKLELEMMQNLGNAQIAASGLSAIFTVLAILSQHRNLVAAADATVPSPLILPLSPPPS